MMNKKVQTLSTESLPLHREGLKGAVESLEGASIPYYPLRRINACYEPELSRAVREAIASGWYLLGNRLDAFENGLARFCGVRNAVGVGNGLDALTLILMALKEREDWSSESEVIVPAMTFVASALAVSRAGLKPVFVDVSAEDYLINPALVAEAVTADTKAVMAVHLYGKVCPMDDLRAAIGGRDVIIIEDAAQAHGACYKGKRAGSLGVAAGMSFYPGKNLGALGDGGAVLTDDDDLAQRVRQLANYGASEKYIHHQIGLNSRLDELQAAVLSVKLKHLDEENERRRHIAALYADLLEDAAVTLPYGGDSNGSVCHIYPLLTEKRTQLREALEAEGVETALHYPLPLHMQPIYKDKADIRGPLAVSERIAAQELSLPIHPLLTDADVERIARIIREKT